MSSAGATSTSVSIGFGGAASKGCDCAAVSDSLINMVNNVSGSRLYLFSLDFRLCLDTTLTRVSKFGLLLLQPLSSHCLL
jgi:hypothetical protein